MSEKRLENMNFGTVRDPLPTDWSRWKIPGFSQEAIDERARRRTSRGRMLRFRSVPVARRVWYVTLTATQADPEEFGSRDLAAGLTFMPQEFWCLSRRRARYLIERDHVSGGSGTMFPVEYRICPVCGRLLLGGEAHDYRMKQFRPARSWQFEQGPACNMECRPRGRGVNGAAMRYRKDSAA